MSAAEVEIARRGIDAYNRGDVEQLLEISDPEVCMVPVRALLEGGEYRGHDGVRRFMADMDEDWAEREILVDEVRDLGGRVLVLGSYRAIGRASGSEVVHPLAWLSDFRDGKLTRLQAFTDRDDALAEVGLDE